MTTEQFEKGTQIYEEIRRLKYSLEELSSNQDAVEIQVKNIRYLHDETASQVFEDYIQITRLAIRAEVMDILKDNIARLENELKEI